MIVWLKHTILRNILSNYVGFGVNAVITLLLTPFLIERLGRAHFGIWVLLNTVLSYFQLLELGTMPAIIRHVSLHRARGEKEAVESVIGSGLWLMLLVSLLTLPATWLAARFGPRFLQLAVVDQPLFTNAVWLVGITAVFAYFKRLFFAVLEGYQRYDVLNGCSLVGAISGALCTVYFVLHGAGVMTLILILLGQTVVETAIEIAAVVKLYGVRPRLSAVTPNHLRAVAGYSWYAFLVDVAVSICYRIDHLVIGIFLPVTAITNYSISTKITGLLEKIAGPMIDTFFPLASDLHTAEKTDSLRKLLVEGTKISLLLVTPGLLVVSFHGADLIRWWVGEEFVAASLPVLWIFLGVVFLSVLESTSARILLGTGNVRFDAYVSLATAISNLALSVWLVRDHGLVGVALGTLIPSFVCALFVAMPYTCRLAKIAVIPFYVEIFKPILFIAVPSVALMVMTRQLVANDIFAFCLNSAGVLMIWAGVVYGQYRSFIPWVRRP